MTLVWNGMKWYDLETLQQCAENVETKSQHVVSRAIPKFGKITKEKWQGVLFAPILNRVKPDFHSTICVVAY